jgi:hypothetical protein
VKKREQKLRNIICFAAFYDAEYLFTVDETVLFRHQRWNQVLRLRRKADYSLPCGEKLFYSGKQHSNNDEKPCVTA